MMIYQFSIFNILFRLIIKRLLDLLFFLFNQRELLDNLLEISCKLGLNFMFFFNVLLDFLIKFINFRFMLNLNIINLGLMRIYCLLIPLLMLLYDFRMIILDTLNFRLMLTNSLIILLLHLTDRFFQLLNFIVQISFK